MGHAKVAKTTTVLELVRTSGERVKGFKFTGVVETVEESSHSVFGIRMVPQMWFDLGQPRKITVTIEPGDTLNEITNANWPVREGVN